MLTTETIAQARVMAERIRADLEHEPDIAAIARAVVQELGSEPGNVARSWEMVDGFRAVWLRADVSTSTTAFESEDARLAATARAALEHAADLDHRVMFDEARTPRDVWAKAAHLLMGWAQGKPVDRMAALSMCEAADEMHSTRN